MESNKPNYFKYKSALFYAFVINICIAVIGSNYFVDAYFIFANICVIYAMSKYLQMMGILIYVNLKYKQAMKSFNKRMSQGHKCTKDIVQVFILPSFKQDYQLIKQSLAVLAKHTRSSNYCVFLAMEKHQEGAELKAKRLVKDFSTTFRLISYTLHELQVGESKTKSSNINWCGTHLTPELIRMGVNIDHVIVNVMDSDSHIPEEYIDQVDRHLEENYENRHLFLYQPPQIFYRNQYESAFFVRIMDNMMSAMHCAQHYSISNFTLGVSNYSLSYRLLQRIGFWDTCIYSKGQDIRIATKSFFKTQGEVKTNPIYIPISQTCLATHEGYFADFKARLEQAKRHSQDQVQLSYVFVNLLHSTIPLAKKLYVMISVCEVYFMPTLIPIHFLFLGMQCLNVIPRSSYDPQANMFINWNNINTVIMIFDFILFGIFKIKASKEIYKQSKLQWHKQILNPFLQLPLVLLFGFLPMIISSVNLLNNNITFTVTKKKSMGSVSDLEIENSNGRVIFQSEQIQQKELMADQKQQTSQVSTRS